MSRHTLQAKIDGAKVDIGYDPLIDSYFLQARVPDANGKVRIDAWLGCGVAGAETSGLIRDPEVVVQRASAYAEVPEGLVAILKSERGIEPKRIESEPVVYAGLPDQQVWRYRKGVDSEKGEQVSVRRHEIYRWERQVAFSILEDFLSSPARAKRLASDFAKLVMEDQLKKKHWLLTEADLASGIYLIENALDLRWLPQQGCYAGKGTTPDLTPEAQLRRAEHLANATRTAAPPDASPRPQPRRRMPRSEARLKRLV